MKILVNKKNLENFKNNMKKDYKKNVYEVIENEIKEFI